MSVLGNHGSCKKTTGTTKNTFIINFATQPSLDVAIITIAVATSLMTATSMIIIVALAWCRDRSRKHTAPIDDNEAGNEALLDGVN
jgi:hypothetical protein